MRLEDIQEAATDDGNAAPAPGPVQSVRAASPKSQPPPATPSKHASKSDKARPEARQVQMQPAAAAATALVSAAAAAAAVKRRSMTQPRAASLASRSKAGTPGTFVVTQQGRPRDLIYSERALGNLPTVREGWSRERPTATPAADAIVTSARTTAHSLHSAAGTACGPIFAVGDTVEIAWESVGGGYDPWIATVTGTGKGSGKGGLTVVYASDRSTDLIEGKDVPFCVTRAGGGNNVLRHHEPAAGLDAPGPDPADAATATVTEAVVDVAASSAMVGGQGSDAATAAVAAAELDAEAALCQHHAELDGRPITVFARPDIRPDDGTGAGCTVCPFCNTRAGYDGSDCRVVQCVNRHCDRRFSFCARCWLPLKRTAALCQAVDEAAWVEGAGVTGKFGAVPVSLVAAGASLSRLARILLQTQEVDPDAIGRSRRVAYGGHDHRHCQNWGVRRTLHSPAAGGPGSAQRPITLSDVLDLWRDAVVAGSLDLSYTGRARGRRRMTSLPAEIGQLVDLTQLHLNYNQLTSLPAEIGQLVVLTELRLDGNQLTSLPAEIGQLAGLKYLELSDNKLTSLPAEIGQLVELMKLYLDGNQLTSLPAEIGQLVGLTDLHFDGNQLMSLPAEIGQLVELMKLYLDGNQLTSLPAEIAQLVGLTRLSLRGSQLMPLPAEAEVLRAGGTHVF